MFTKYYQVGSCTILMRYIMLIIFDQDQFVNIYEGVLKPEKRVSMVLKSNPCSGKQC